MSGKNEVAKASDLNTALSLPFENVNDATKEMKEAYQGLLDLGDNTFGQSKFSEKNFVINAQMTPHRTYRQCLLHYDGKRHALAEAQAGKAKAAAKLSKAEGDLFLLEKVKGKIGKMSSKPEKLPSYRYEVVEHETVSSIEFNPGQIMEFYDDDEWPDCKAHLARELDSIIVLKRAEISTIRRGQFQQEKLEKDAVSDIKWYEAEILPPVKAAVDAAINNGIDFEKEEETYWRLRFSRDIETRQIEQITGLPHDYLQSISQLPDTMSANLIEFAKENKLLLEKEGIPNTFRYKKHAADACNQLTGGKIDDMKKLTTKAYAERNTQGNICLGMLFRDQAAAEEKGVSDPDGMLFTPRGFNVQPVQVWGMKTDDARNFVVQKALEAGADWVFFVDDDVIIPKMALRDLLAIAIENNWGVVGGDYPLKKNPYESASLVYVGDGDSGRAISPVIEKDGVPCIPDELYEAGLVNSFDYAGEEWDAIDCNAILATGCILIRADILREMGGDWFREYRRQLAPGVSQMIRTDDAPFTTRAVELGHMPKLIPHIKCQHVDLKKKRIYGSKLEDVDYCINNRSNPFLIAQESGKLNPKAVVYVPRRSLKHVPYVNMDMLSRPKCIGLAVPEPPVGMRWDEAWTYMAKTAIGNDADYLIIIEDDMIVPRDAVSRLIHSMQDNDYDFICGSYVRKDMTNESAHIAVGPMMVKNDNEGTHESGLTEFPFPDPFEKRGIIENNHVVCFGCCIINCRVFADLPFPWFAYVPAGSEIAYQGRKTGIPQTITHDAFFVQRMFKAGFKSAVDTDLQCLHVDIETGRVYGYPGFVTEDYELMMSNSDMLAMDPERFKEIKISAS